MEPEPQLEVGIERRTAGSDSLMMRTVMTSALVSTTEKIGCIEFEWPGASLFWCIIAIPKDCAIACVAYQSTIAANMVESSRSVRRLQ